MKITLITLGTRGDIQPYIPLAKGFHNAGYEITVATHEIYRDFICKQGLNFYPLAVDVREILQGEAGVAWIETRNPFTLLSKLRDMVIPVTQELARDIIASSEGADAILYSSLAYLIVTSLIEKHKMPAMGVFLQPIHASPDFTMSFVPPAPMWLPFPKQYNLLSHRIVSAVTDKLFRPIIDDVRQGMLDLSPLNETLLQLLKRPISVTHGFSPTVISKPPNWDKITHISGYWFLDEDYEPSNKFSEWLAVGESPVYIGFGSMTHRDKDATTDTILKAIELAGVRCVLLSGWAEIGRQDLPDTVFVVDNIPHSWLFPKMAAVVHHGGAGTSAAGLRAGVPSIIVPHFGDQPFWADRIYKLGVSPKPIPRNKLSAEKLAQAITEALTDGTIRKRATEVGEKIRAEDGVGNAIRFFEDTVLRHDFSELFH